MFIIFIIAGVVCALIGATMASSRNRSALLWGIICAFTGLIGIIILAAIGSESKNNFSGVLISDDIGRKKWETLKEVDTDIAIVAKKAMELGSEYEKLLSEKFLAVNDKAYLPAILKSVEETAEKEKSLGLVDRQRGHIKGSQFKVNKDMSYTIVAGRHVGKRFRNFDEMEKFLS